ncbi:hypothetical protein B9Z55_018876 [Caenorhabditis nigoni]|uniref:Mitoguardin n=1 Tax=Caenorhabditis nigoni TaxID=1611254 RepID=A0A2G5TG50_9PELO|nr:hypothetical protein B9Z55_018876 [Caenorhabditis nigoni]
MTSHLMQGLPGGLKINDIVTKRTVLSVAAGIGIGIVFANFVRYWRQRREPRIPLSAFIDEVPKEVDTNLSQPAPSLRRSHSGRGMRPSSSQGERSLRNSVRQNSQRSLSMNPIEADITNGQEMCTDLRKTIERVHHNLEMVKNRSSKDMERSIKIEGILKGLKQVEDEITLLIPHMEDFRDDNTEFYSVSGGTGYAGSVRTGRSRTLSVLSDDSFQSAVEEFAVDIDDIDFVSEAANLEKEELKFLDEGMRAAMNGEVKYRKSRMDFCNCESETDFAAKLYCVRQALTNALKDEHKRVWLAKCGRTLLADFIRHTKQDPVKFFNAYDEMLEYVSNDRNQEQLRQDVEGRGVCETGFYDVAVDFIILDAFEDLKSPPSAVYSVTKNYFMSMSMKYSTLNTIIWSIIKSKRQRLKNPDGFIAKFYNISETVMPAITLGFLGTDERLGELCQYFKEQVVQFVLDVFNTQRVCYRSLEEMTEDVWIVMRNRLEAVQTRMSNELLPA